MLLQKVIEYLYYFGESFILSLACLTYIGLKPSRKSLLLFSLSFGLFLIIIRVLLFPALHIPPGVHMIVLFLCNIFFLLVIFKLSILGAIISDFFYYATILLFENIILAAFTLFGFTPAMVVSSPEFLNIFRWVNFSLIALLVFVMLKMKFVLFPINKVLKLERNE